MTAAFRGTNFKILIWFGVRILSIVLLYGCDFSKTTVYNAPIPLTVDRYNSDCRSQHIGRGVGRVPTDIPTDSVDRRSISSNNMSTDYRPICRPTYRPSVGRYVGRLLIDISAESIDRYSVDRCLKYT